jgi:hypothetical protein
MKQKALKMTIKRKAESMVITCGEWWWPVAVACSGSGGL